MYCYMINVNPPGEYYRAFEHSLKSFRGKDPQEMARCSGAVYNSAEQAFYLSSMNEEIRVTYPAGEVAFAEKNLPPLWEWQLIILNYLSRADGRELLGEPVSYRELEGGEVFYPNFKKNSIDKITANLGNQPPEKILRVVGDLGGRSEGQNKITARFDFLPRFQVMVQIWLADEELPASANILFDSSANGYLHTEDIAVVGFLVADFMSAQLSISE